MTFTADQNRHLAEQLPRDVIKQLPRKGAPDYITGHYVICRLNAVFGFDGWRDTYGEPTVRPGPRPAIYVRCTLTAGDVARDDIGVGVAADDSADAFETAIKGAYTDGLKRAARKLGDSFGLALYEKVTGNQTRAGVGLSTRALAMLDEIDALTTADGVTAWLAANADAASRLDEDEKDEIRGAAAARRRSCRERETASVAPSTDAPSGEHQAAPRTEQPRTEQPVATGAAQTAPSPTQTAPSRSQAFGVAAGRLAVVRTVQGIVATLRGATVAKEEREALWSLGLAAAKRLSVAEADLTARLTKAAELGATTAQWSTVAQVLAAVDTCTSATALDAVRKQYAQQVTALPEKLLLGVKTATTERARELGAATVAAKLLEEISGAKRAEELSNIYARLQTAAANGQVSKSEGDEVTAALNARADALTTRAA